MKKHVGIAILFLLAALVGGCGEKSGTQDKNTEPSMGQTQKTSQESQTKTDATELSDGIYTAEFNTDSSMFHVSEACNGQGTLTVADGEMTIHISLNSKRIVNLYPGLAKDAEKEGAEWLSPTEDTVTYSDGMTEEVYGFDVPVPAIGEEFDLALIGTKGKWYDHKASVSNPVPTNTDAQQKSTANSEDKMQETAAGDDAQRKNIAALENGVYDVDFTFEGGSGRAELLSPAKVTVEDGTATATVQWSSSNYDYMIVNEKKYLPASMEGGSLFEFPISKLDEPIEVIGDTVAMSRPHEVEYTLTFHSETMKKDSASTM